MKYVLNIKIGVWFIVVDGLFGRRTLDAISSVKRMKCNATVTKAKNEEEKKTNKQNPMVTYSEQVNEFLLSRLLQAKRLQNKYISFWFPARTRQVLATQSKLLVRCETEDHFIRHAIDSHRSPAAAIETGCCGCCCHWHCHCLNALASYVCRTEPMMAKMREKCDTNTLNAITL